MERKDVLREELVSAQRDLINLLDRLGADDWARATPNEGWTIRDLLVHLSTAESGFVGTLRRMAAGEGGVPGDFDPNRWNASQLRRRADSSPEQLRSELEAAHVQMLALLDSLDEVALGQVGHMSSGVDGTTEDNLRLVASHKREHTAHMRAALGAAGLAT